MYAKAPVDVARTRCTSIPTVSELIPTLLGGLRPFN